MSEELSEEQIKNWRRVLIGMFGPYALLMPKEQIQLFRDRLQGGLTQDALDPATPLVHGPDSETCEHPDCVAKRNTPGK